MSGTAEEVESALSALEWQIELGATEAIGEAPVNRYDLEDRPPVGKAPAAATPHDIPVGQQEVDPVAEARGLAGAADNLDALRQAMAGFPHCELRHGARNLVFSDGRPGATIMLVGEAPGREEDIEGRPFVGRAGRLLDAMFGAIGRSRTTEDPSAAIYITNVLPWRPPQNRDPSPEELAMLTPFLERHIELANPKVLVLLGNHACAALIGRRGITRLRGQWTEVLGRPAVPMFHPAYLLRTPGAKRETWNDLLSLKDRMRNL